MTKWGYRLTRAAQRDPEVPSALEHHARRALSACPLQALQLVPSERT